MEYLLFPTRKSDGFQFCGEARLRTMEPHIQGGKHER